MDFFFSGLSSPREVDYLLQAEVEKILINPVDFHVVGHLIPSEKTLILDSMAYKIFKRGQTPRCDDWRSLTEFFVHSKRQKHRSSPKVTPTAYAYTIPARADS